MSIYAVFKLECLKIKHKANHFVLRAKLFIFWAGRNEILQAWYRRGNVYTSNGVVKFVKQLLVHLPSKMRFITRADSGYFFGTLLDLLDAHKHGYLIKVKLVVADRAG